MKQYLWLIIFNLLYLVPFTIYYLSIRNFEFLWYVFITVFFFLLILGTIRKTGFDATLLWGLSIWGFLHMAGGGVRIGEGVLYGLQVLPLYSKGEMVLLKYDQVVHLFGFGAATLLGYQLLRPMLGERVSSGVLYFLLALIGMGLGAFNEIVEFIAVVIFPETGVGGYINTALDLVFNMFGALCALIFIHLRYRTAKL